MAPITYGATTTGSLSGAGIAKDVELMIALYMLAEMGIMDRRMTGSALTVKGGIRMIDREKVKTGIFEMLQRNTWKDIDKERHRFQPVLNDALALLKEQEPVEPVISPETKYHKMYKNCGACGAFLANGARYCSFCGRMAKRNDLQ